MASAVPSTHVAATASALAAVPSVASGPPDNAPSPWAVGPASLEGDHVNKDRRIPLLPPLSGVDSVWAAVDEGAVAHATAGATHWVRPSLRL